MKRAGIAGLISMLAAIAVAQTSPGLPTIDSSNFGPGIREQVEAAYDEAQRHPQEPAIVGKLGMTLHAYEDHAAAVACYSRARQLAQAEFKWTYLLGVAELELGRATAAAEALREASRLKPDYFPAQLKLAEALLAAGEKTESEQIYLALASAHPSAARLYYGLGRIKAAERDAAAAVEYLRRACEIFPAYGAAHYALALAYRDLGQADRARDHLQLYQKHKRSHPSLVDPVLEEVLALNRGATGRMRAGFELAAEGRIAEAIAEYERALEADPQLIHAHIILIQLYGQSGETAKAEEHYRAAVALNPEIADSHYNYGVLLVEAKRMDEAATAFRRALATNPQHASAHYNLGLLLEADRQYDQALDHYRAAVEHAPNHRPSHFQLARMLIYKGRLEEAINELKLTIEPEDEETPRYLYALASAYARAGEREQAIKYAREARARAVAYKQSELLSLIERDLKILEGK